MKSLKDTYSSCVFIKQAGDKFVISDELARLLSNSEFKNALYLYLWQHLNRGELDGYSRGEKYIDLNVLNKNKSLDDLIVQ
jgi:hypothetical protein